MEKPLNKFNPQWKLGLLKTMKNPNSIVAIDNWITVIKDSHPKAEVHYLVLPNSDVRDLNALNRSHIELLKHMENVAKQVIDREDKSRTFMVGYHAEPSMLRLHMHIISDDFNSECLKTKRHWNSFTTNFFIKPEDVILSIERNGIVSILTPQQCKQCLNAPLRCHKCMYTPKNLPDLKNHILIHK